MVMVRARLGSALFSIYNYIYIYIYIYNRI